MAITKLATVALNVACEKCNSAANHGVRLSKNNTEENFYGCTEHYLSIISDKVNSGYDFVGGFNVIPEAVENKPVQTVESKPVQIVESVPEVVAEVMTEVVPVPSRVVLSNFSPVIEAPIVLTPVEEVAKPVLKLVEKAPEIDEKSGREISQTGKLRAVIDASEAELSGFALKHTLYSVGTKVVDVGVENFKRSRQEFEKKPTVSDACATLIEKIQSEQRRDKITRVNEVGMLPDGRITKVQNNQFGRSSIVLAHPKTLGQLMMRSGLNNTGTGYLESCPPLLRAQNVNHWLATSDPKSELKLRMRKVMNKGVLDDEIYAVVGPNYSTFDADKIAQIVSDVCPKDGRAEVVYDGFKTRISVEFHSDIKPEECVAGELFKAGIIIKTSDTGDGAIKVQAFVERNLCLNLIIIDQAIQTVVKRRHTGDRDTIAEVINRGIEAANKKIEGFVKRWGFANKEDLLKNSIDLEHKSDAQSPRFSLSHELFMAGLFNGMIDQELITVKGKKETAIENLLDAWSHEPQVTRAGAINAITRYAHESEQSSPWDEDVLQEEAGRILFSNRPLPWLNPES